MDRSSWPGGLLRGSLSDFYFNSWRLVPANLAWGALMVAALVAGPGTPVGIALLALLAVPTAGIYRMAALIARGEPATLSDFTGGMRRFGARGVVVGVAAGILAVVFATNVVVGLESGNPLGWFVSAMALWGLVGLVMGLVALWPLLVDPDRDGAGLRAVLVLAGLVVIGRPGRMLFLTVVVAAVLAVSTIAFALLLMVALAFVALFTARFVLPLADDLEARLPEAHRSR